MKSTYLLGLLLAVFCVTGLCNPDTQEAQTGDQIQEQQLSGINPAFSSIHTSNANFAFQLYKKLASEKTQENVLFSPLSISTAFALLSLGTKGTTLSETLEGLGFNLTETSEVEIHRSFQQLLHSLNLPNDDFQLSSGNALFTSKHIELIEKFQQDSKLLYSTEVFPANFQDPDLATKQINDYVEKQTQGKIINLFDRLDKNTVMVLVNHIFFKAKWETPFASSDTFKEKFFVSENKTVDVSMMGKAGFHTRIFQDKELFCTVVELKYRGNATALFILPDITKMKTVEDALSLEVLNKWKNSLQERQIQLYLPKFSISSNYELEKILPAIGIKELFTDDANLSGISEQAKDIKISKAVHKAVMDVDETGTEAAAATGVEFVLTSMRFPSPIVINFDRPFIVILYNENNILFLAKVNNPQNEHHLEGEEYEEEGAADKSGIKGNN
ncbi:serine protease inhibitor A3N-like [Antechinus flavipes]|uniref:serine protease inhibitor A3N-like n=1 Tax=Antechinus flavipes TaxID=38775 RepID=UPI002235D6E3|nr:serine protease inhibitor A3N-like [Antechinus flavipes]